ncbi:uncharacterized protein BO72DRAFT_443868 [Aspergillus fijiensis CBS 313.89]|uniref:Uncharacterized protein n=1 Tax=Aspergillus fijiensis CBS 313.89 TaxID=1448319 RepID=A0A8G1W460_9EURO|nr:uncharacterized protein BO72DRAFT_443868 [Aspergillus fijiensis CBS 313.89]RAK82413.1 hypothetical protein BO72DRAFT_443868 [Aspergillus fijiensis CBS 313.89]
MITWFVSPPTHRGHLAEYEPVRCKGRKSLTRGRIALLLLFFVSLLRFPLDHEYKLERNAPTHCGKTEHDGCDDECAGRVFRSAG